MAQNDPQLNFRCPPQIKAALEAAAKTNGRSLNAEIVFRLERSLESTPDEHIDMSKTPPDVLEKAAKRAMEMIIKEHPNIFRSKGTKG